MATWTAVAAGGNWRDTTTWAEGGGYPVAGDTVVINATHTGTVTMNEANACAVLNMTNNGGTFAFRDYVLTVTGDVSLGGTITRTYAASGITASGTDARIITSNGVALPNALVSTNAKTITLKGNLTVNGFTVSASSATVINSTGVGDGDVLTCSGFSSGANTSGTTEIVIAGGEWSGAGSVANDLTFNCSSATISGTVYYKTGTLTYTAGTITTTGSTLNVNGSCTLDTDRGATKISFVNMKLENTVTITLLSDLTATGNVALGTGNGSAITITMAGEYNINFGTLITSTVTGNNTVTLVAGTTLTISSGTTILAPRAKSTTFNTTSGGSVAYLVYLGTVANCVVVNAVFTDIDASGSSCVINNYNGGTLSNTTGIVNRVPGDFNDMFSWIG